jgi:uncharacterized membrane protein
MSKRAVAGVSPLNDQQQKEKSPLLGGIQVKAAITIRQSPKVCYDYWRDFENLPRFMSHVQSVSVVDHRHSHWVVAAPADTTADWDAEIMEDVPNERISWRSLAKAQVDNAGSVEFVSKADGQQTEVKVVLTYDPPFGVIGEAVASLFHESPENKLEADLARFKKILEGGKQP